jgi:hypothetical protein
MIRNTIKYRHRVFIRSVACLRHQQLVFTLERKSHNHHRVTYSHLHYNSFCSEYSKFTHDRRAVLDGAQRGGVQNSSFLPPASVHQSGDHGGRAHPVLQQFLHQVHGSSLTHGCGGCDDDFYSGPSWLQIFPRHK